MEGAGYRIEIVFLRLDSPAVALRRIAARVRQGGHDVPAPMCSDASRAGARSFPSIAPRRCVGGLRQQRAKAGVTGEEPMKPKHKPNPATSDLAARAGRALRRAATVARKTARLYGTPIYYARTAKSSPCTLSPP